MNLGRDLSFLQKPANENIPICLANSPGTTATAQGLANEGEHDKSKLHECTKEGEPLATKVSSKEGEQGIPNTSPKEKSTRQRIIDGEWADLIAEKGYSAQSKSLDNDIFASMHMAKIAAHEGNESAFHMYFKLAQLEHYIRRDTPRK